MASTTKRTTRAMTGSPRTAASPTRRRCTLTGASPRNAPPNRRRERATTAPKPRSRGPDDDLPRPKASSKWTSFHKQKHVNGPCCASSNETTTLFFFLATWLANPYIVIDMIHRRNSGEIHRRNSGESEGSMSVRLGHQTIFFFLYHFHVGPID